MERMQRQLPQQQFFKRMKRPQAPFLQVNNTPIRIHQTNKENNQQLNSKKNEYLHKQHKQTSNSDSHGQAKTALKKKSAKATCSNHPEASASYLIQIDNESMVYCQKCAAYLASNGFTIQKLTPSAGLPQNRENKSANPKRKYELNGFISALQQLQKKYVQKDEQMKRVKASHEIQKETIGNFYASMLQYVEYIKNQHVNFLQEESERFEQLSELQTRQIGETLDEIEAMREDIEHNVDKIVEEVDEESYSECMGYYSKQKAEHERRLQQLRSQSGGMTTSAQMVSQKLNQFKVFMEQLTGINCAKEEEEYL